jgi:exosome complex exonuclease DIS3/RRP44
VPSDKKMPRVRVHTRQYAALLGQRVVVAIDSWPRTSRYPIGHYVRTLGALGDAATDTTALLLQYDIPHAPFTRAVLACCPPHPWSLALEDQTALARRADMRALRVVSVDPPGMCHAECVGVCVL